MRKLLLASALLLGISSAASAACTGPAVMHDFPGTSFNMALGQDPSGGCASNVNVLQNGALNATGNPFYFLFGTGATLPAFAVTPTFNLGTIGTAATAANQTNKTQFTQLTDGANAAATYTAYGTAPTGNVLGANVFVTNTNANGPAAASASSPVTPSNLPPGAAAINTNQVSVAATAGGTLIVAARTGVAGTGRVSVTVCNTGTTVVYIGNTGLTTSTGQYLAGVAGACLTLNTTAAIYGIVATGTETVAYSETY